MHLNCSHLAHGMGPANKVPVSVMQLIHDSPKVLMF